MPSALVQIYGSIFAHRDGSLSHDRLVQRCVGGERSSELKEDLLTYELSNFQNKVEVWQRALAAKLLFWSEPHGSGELPSLHMQGGREAIYRACCNGTAAPYSASGDVESLSVKIEKALLFLLLSLHEKESESIEKALESVRSVMDLLDLKGRPFSGLFTQFNTFSSAEVYGLGYLLFATAAHLAEWPKYHLVAETLLTHFKDLDTDAYEAISPYHVALALHLEELLEKGGFPHVRGVPGEDEGRKSDIKCYHYESLSLACTTVGDHSGICAMGKGEARIVSFGPSREPIGEPENYGVLRVGPVSDIVTQKGSETFDFVGWSRLAAKKGDELSKEWLELTVKGRRARAQLGVKFTNLEEPIKLLFFVQCEKITVGEGGSLEAASLDRYTGESGVVSMRSGSQVLNIQMNGGCQLEIIPLAGKDHFLGANFLLAYSTVNDSESMTWDLY